jgi:hypothetical protein
LDHASPKLTQESDDKNDFEINKIKLKDLNDTDQLSEEDRGQLLKDKELGIPQETSFANMMRKKRYQLGTRLYAPEVIDQTNLNSIFDDSELKNYLKEKENPAMEQYITDKIANGEDKETVKKDVALRLIQKDIEDDLYNSK